jgi:hypothetical protein
MAFTSISAMIRLWNKFHVLKLTRNMQTTESEKEFSGWLLEAGDGRSGATVSLPPSSFPNTQDPVEQLYGDITSTLQHCYSSATQRQRAMLSVTNEDSLELNNKVLDHMPEEETVYISVETVASQEPSDHLAYPEEFLNSLILTGMPHKLKLKVDAVIMLLRNLMSSWGLCNGRKLTITHLQRHIVEAYEIDGLNLDTALIPHIPLIPSDTNMPVKFKRRYVYMLYVVFMFSLFNDHQQSQGLTFDKIYLHLPTPVFNHGQQYVALSRVRSLGSLSVVSEMNKIFNCVYNQIYE